MLSGCKVDIIIPVFNDSSGLKRCLLSLEEQLEAFPSCGVIVVDNGSSPPIEPVVTDGIPLRLLKCETPGSYAARNAGVAESNADVLVFLDADCVPSEGWLLNGLKTLLGYDGPCIVGGDVRFFKSEKPSATEVYQLMVGFGQEENIRERHFSVTANLFTKMTTIREVGGFNEGLLSGGDKEWCLRAGEAGCPVVFDASAIVYTEPRKTLMQAITQARRVAGGRYVMQESQKPVEAVTTSGPSSEKGLVDKAGFVLKHSDFGVGMRLSVFGVATLIFLARKLETIRLRLGSKMERR